jgi:hypothetical protein
MLFSVKSNLCLLSAGNLFEGAVTRHISENFRRLLYI